MELVELVQVEDASGPFEPKTPVDVDMEVSSDSIDEEEEDVVRFEDDLNVVSCVANALEAPKLSQNVSEASESEGFPFHLIQDVTHPHLHYKLSLESFKIEYSSKPRMSISIVSPEFEVFYHYSGSNSVDWHGDIIILLSSN